MKIRLRSSFGFGRAAAVATLLASAIAPAAMAADMIGNCEVTGEKGSSPITPAIAGQLTVEVSLPAPGWWNGDTPDQIKDGYEYCMAANIAYRAGLDKVKVVPIAWAALIAGQTKKFDLALSEISITDERKKVVDFSEPYFNSDIGVLIKKGTPVDDASLKKMRVGVQEATTGSDFVYNKLKPADVRVFAETTAMFTALAAGQIDAAMTDTAIVLGKASQSNGILEVAAQFSTGNAYGALYPKGSPNGKIFDAIIDSLKKDGTLNKLSANYLTAAWGTDPLKIPFLKLP